jgi:aryl-alcohol dehydrogenase-like predicted oxidoreductase
MITATWNDYQLSRLMLGTVQFGLPYGVGNRTGQPTYGDALAMVAAAVEGGVNCFDTAAAYGTSEEVLGRALHELGVADRVIVVTKVRPLTAAELADGVLAARAIERSVADSRQRLRLDCLPVVLFHREADAAYCDVLARLRTQGWLHHAGVSCDNRPGPATAFVAAGQLSALQLPANVLDRRHQRSGVFPRAAARGVAVFIRSVYLQGLLLMPEDDIPPALREVVPARRCLASLASAAGMPLAELAVRFMLAQPGVTCVLTGVETVAQVHENLAIVARGPLPADLLRAIDLATPELSETLITPSLWPRRSDDGAT